MYNRFKVHKLLPCIICALLIVAFGCKKNNAVSEIKSRGKLIVGIREDDAPFSYVDLQGERCGFEIRIARRLAEELLGDENKIEFVTLKARERIDVLQSDKVDIVLSTFTKKQERLEKVDFCEPYMKTSLGVAVLESIPIKLLEEAINENKCFIVGKGTVAELYLKSRQIKNRIAFDSKEEILQALKDGKGDAILHDARKLLSWSCENAELKIIETHIGNVEVIAPAVKKGNKELQEWVNSKIKELAKEHFFLKIYEEELQPYYANSIKNPYDLIIESE